MPRILPKKSEIPSESTIEPLTNLFIMQSLSHLSAWILCPTRYQENSLGYDGAIRNTKFAVIQYKRIKRVNKNSLSIEIDEDQLKTLKNNFKKLSKPTAFYCFSFFKQIKDIELTFDSSLPRFNPSFYSSIFFNALELPLGCSSVKWTYCKNCYPSPCGKNSLEAYEKLLRRYHPLIFGLVLFLLHNLKTAILDAKFPNCKISEFKKEMITKEISV